MIVCEHNSCLKELEIADFKRRDVYPCCGKPLGQSIHWPEPQTHELTKLPELELPSEEPAVVEEPVKEKAPAKKKASKAKKAKK